MSRGARRPYTERTSTSFAGCREMTAFIDDTPLWIFLMAALTLGLAPFTPEPHLVEKLKMLAAGTLAKPIDIFDLVMHAAPWALLVAKAVRLFLARGA